MPVAEEALAIELPLQQARDTLREAIQSETLDALRTALANAKEKGLKPGDKEVEFDGGYETDGHIVVIQDQALPLTILSIYPRITTFDE